MAIVDILKRDGIITIIACHVLPVPGLRRALHAASGRRVLGRLLRNEDYILRGSQ